MATGKRWEPCDLCGARTQLLSNDPDAALVCAACSQEAVDGGGVAVENETEVTEDGD